MEHDIVNPARIRVACSICGARDSRYERTVNDSTLERCRRCGFVFANPQYDAASLTRLYSERDSEELIRLYSRIAAPAVLDSYERTLDLLERWLPERGRLLDFGCAAGYFFELAARRGWEAHGSDISAWTRAAAQARGLDNLHVGSLQELAFPDGYFDAVYAAQIFEHLPAPREDLQEIRRILRPGGLLWVDVPNYRTLPILMDRDDFVLNRPPQHLAYFTPPTLRRLLADGGFTSVRITSMGGLKWENLVGQPVKSEILSAYRLGDRPQVGCALVKAAKRAVLASLIEPIFYRRLKVGMLLVATARRP